VFVPWQKSDEPVMVGVVFTVTGAVAVHPVELSVYVTVAVPADIPVTVAFVPNAASDTPLLELHEPEPEAELTVSEEEPTHTVADPPEAVIGDGAPLTVTVVAALPQLVV